MNLATSPLYRAPLFGTLPSDAVARLERASEEKHFRRRQVIFFAEQRNDHVFLLNAGRVKLIRTSSGGREVTIGIVNTHELFGECGLYDPIALYACTAETLEDCSATAFRRVDLEAALDEHLGLMRELLRTQFRQRQEAESRISELVFYDVSTRLAHLLASMAAQSSSAGKGGSLLKLKLTHQELANLIGSTRETTTLILNDFRRRGLIEFAGRRIIVLDRPRLSQLESSPPAGFAPAGK